MALMFPLDMPDPPEIRACTFMPRYAQATAPTRGGLVQVVNLGPDLWQIRYETPSLSEAQAAKWEAWLQALRGGARLFKAWHPLRRYALAYPGGYSGLKRAGGDDFDGTCLLHDVGVALDTLTLKSLPEDFVLSPGDMLSFAVGEDGQALHRVVEGAIANEAGALTVTVEPTVRPDWDSDAVVSLEKPWCKAVLDASSVRIDWRLGRRAEISFSAVQVL